MFSLELVAVFLYRKIYFKLKKKKHLSEKYCFWSTQTTLVVDQIKISQEQKELG